MWKVLISWFPFYCNYFHLELDEYSMNKYLCKAHKWNSGNNVAQKKVTVIFSINIIPFSLMFPHYSDGWFKLKLISWFPFKYQHLLNVNIKQTKMYKNIVNEPYLYSRCGKIPRKNIFFHVKKFVSWFYYFKFQPQYSVFFLPYDQSRIFSL